MKYLNQLEYPHIPYHTNTAHPELPEERRNRTVRQSGCGLCAVCMAIDILTDTQFPLEECVKLSETCGASHAVGTDMKVLGPVIAEKFGLTYRGTGELSEAIAHLQAGGQVIALVGVPEGAEIGLFTKGGHYINLISTDGKEFCILDPSYSPDKFKEPTRAGRVDESHAPYLYCDVDTVHAERKPGRDVVYHLFARKR